MPSDSQNQYHIDPSITNINNPDKKESLIPVITLIIVAINVLVYYYIEMTGSSYDSEYMVKMGAMYEPLFMQGEYYRLITHFFLHFGFAHLANNMISLLVLGYALENVIGRVSFTTIYFLSGILAGVTSLLYNMYMGVSVVSGGASGAIFGLMGALLAILIFKPKRGFSTEVPRLLIYIGICVYSGVQDPTIDNAAHVGGCIAGFFVCSVILLIKRNRTRQ